jgi:thiamine biosynthesis protein ThiS
MVVKINGKPYDAPEGARTVEEFAALMKLKPQNTLLKLNHRHLPWDQWPLTPVAADDVIEILVFAAGG